MAFRLADYVNNKVGCAFEDCSIYNLQFLHSMSKHVQQRTPSLSHQLKVSAPFNECAVDVLGEQYEGTSLRLRKPPIHAVRQHEFEEGETGIDVTLHKTTELPVFLKFVR